MTEIADVTAAAEAYGSGRYDQGKADQRTVDQPVIDQLNAQVTALEADETADEATIAQLRATIAGLSARFPGDPGVGQMYVGLSTGGGDPTKREAKFGATVGISRTYEPAPDPSASVALCKRDLAAGRLPLHSTKLPGTWADVAAGKYDDVFVKPLMDGLSQLGGPVPLCFQHEPYDNQGPGQTPDTYRAMYDHVATLKPANVALTPIMQASPMDPQAMPVGTVDPRLWYPQSADIIGIDNYNHASFAPANKKKWRTAEQVLAIVDVLQAAFPGKPVIFAEFGVRTNPAAPGAAAQWLRDFQAGALKRGVVGIAYFDSNLNVKDGGSPWTLDYAGDGTDGSERLNAYGPLVAVGAHLARS